jgi:hypothetical protein
MKFEENIGEIPGKTRKKKANVIRKKQKPTTRRFYHKHIDKNTSKNDTNILKNRKDLFTEITDSEILQPLRQKPKPKPKPKQKAGNPKLFLNTYAKGLEQELNSFSSEKDKKKGEFQPYGFTTETGLPGNNNAVESVNNLFRHFLEPNTKPERKDKWKRKHFMRKGFLLPQNKTLDENGDEVVNDENNRPNLQYNVSVLQNEVGDFLNPVMDIRKFPNQTLDSLNDVIPAATGDEKHKDIDTEKVEIGGDETDADADSVSEPESENTTKPKLENLYVFEDDILTEMAMGILLSLFPKDLETSPGAPGVPGAPGAPGATGTNITNINNITNGPINVPNVPVSTPPTQEDDDIALQIALALMDNNPLPPPGPKPSPDDDIALQIALALTDNNPLPPSPDDDNALQIALALIDNNPLPPGPKPKQDEDIALQIALALTDNNPLPPSPTPTPKPDDSENGLALALGLIDLEKKPPTNPNDDSDDITNLAIGIACSSSKKKKKPSGNFDDIIKILENPKDTSTIKEIPIHLTEIDYSAKTPLTLNKFTIKDKYMLMEDNLEQKDKYSNLSNMNIEIKNKG